MADQNNKPNGMPPAPNKTPGKTNWGLWILIAVITGILALAFMSDDGFGNSTKSLTLEKFEEECRAGKVILNGNKEHFPVEVTTANGSTKANIKAYRLKDDVTYNQNNVGTFLLSYRESEAIKNLLNRAGITDTYTLTDTELNDNLTKLTGIKPLGIKKNKPAVEQTAQNPGEEGTQQEVVADNTKSETKNNGKSFVYAKKTLSIPKMTTVINAKQFEDFCNEGRILFAKNSNSAFRIENPVIIRNQNDDSRIVFGKYRLLSDPAKIQKDKAEPISVNFNAAMQGDKVKELLGNNYTHKIESNTWQAILINCLPVVIIIFILIFLFRSQGGGAGGAMKFARSRARLLDPAANNITFKDVAGISEAKEELWEIVEFLRNPKKFRNLGGTIPKGVLMVGPPGTGKTLLAKAIAGEADVPFYTISGSDFVEMFVGVGASRVRDMFAEAKKNSPCLIFIDEIDAVGRHRGHGVGGGHDEREQTLNAMLVEMDGFTPNENVIVIAATNRVDVLDPALLRPGRFDRQVVVHLPDCAGREQILRVHVRKIKLDPSVNLTPIAKATTGFSGAELANLVNEAALIAARKNQNTVTQADLEEAREKVRWGRERRSMELSDKEKYNTAVHEAGHALCLLKTPLAKSLPLHKVTIIPRGPALGVTMMLPDEDKHSEYKSELLDYIVMAMGGRCAEQVVFGDISGGARGDIQQATSIARKMVCVYGMSDKLGPIEYGTNHNEVFLARDISQTTRNYSERTAQMIDEEIQRIVTENYQRAINILTENKDKLLLVADKLIEYETLSGEHIAELVETGTMLNPPTRELPPPVPEDLDAPTDLETPDDNPPTPEQIQEDESSPRI